MDLDSIFFIRTSAGEASLANPGVTMSPAFRRMLQLLDGTRSLAELSPLFPQLDAEDMRMWISELLRQKKIKRAPSLTRSQRMRLRENTPAQEMQVKEIAEQIRPWLAGKEMDTTGPRQRAAQLARSARLAAIEASTAAGSMGREGFFVSAEPTLQPPASCAPGLILVVEDDEIQAKIVAKYLEKDGHQVRLAHDGEAALAMLHAGPLPQLVLLDVELPGMDGFAVLEQLRAAPETQDVRVIMLTGQAERANLAKGVVLGANGYITKPFQPEQLRLAVRRLWPEA